VPGVLSTDPRKGGRCPADGQHQLR
jgi:hypothetical protein